MAEGRAERGRVGRGVLMLVPWVFARGPSGSRRGQQSKGGTGASGHSPLPAEFESIFTPQTNVL